MRGVGLLRSRGAKALLLALSAIGLIYVFGTLLSTARPYAVEVPEGGFYPTDGPSAHLEAVTAPSNSSASDGELSKSTQWHSEAMAKLKDKFGPWLSWGRIYGQMNPPTIDSSKSMDSAPDVLPLSAQTNDQKMTVGKLSILSPSENELIERAVRTHTMHDTQHGYQHYIMRQQSSSKTFAALVLSILEAELEKSDQERLEWLYHFPATSMVLNPNIPLELFLPPAQGASLNSTHLVFAEPAHLSTPDASLDHVVFAAKVTRWSVELFQALAARAHTSSHPEHGGKEKEGSSASLETPTLSTLLALPSLLVHAHALRLPSSWFNAWPSTVSATAAPSAPTRALTDFVDPDDNFDDLDDALVPHQVRRGSFVLDLPLPASSSGDDDTSEGGRWRDTVYDDDGDDETAQMAQKQRFEHWLTRAESRSPLWEPPAGATWYPDEARAFWENAAAGGVQSSRPSGNLDREQQERLRGDVLRLVKEMEAGVRDWKDDVDDDVRRVVESRCGRAKEVLAEIELDAQGSGTITEDMEKRLQGVISELKKVNQRFHRHTTHARHALIRTAQQTLDSATTAMTSVHTAIPATVDSGALNAIKSRIETAVKMTVHLRSVLDRKDWVGDEIRTAVSNVQDAVQKVDERIKQAGEAAKKVEEMQRMENERMALMEAAEKQRQRIKEESDRLGFKVPWRG